MAGNRNILIVDDDRLTCWGLEKIISDQGMLVTVVNNGNDALTQVRRTPFGSVLLDVNLPDVSGLEVLREIKLLSPHTKVIVITADSSDQLRKKALEGGAFHFMLKPFGVPEIREVLDRCLPGSHPGGEDRTEDEDCQARC